MNLPTLPTDNLYKFMALSGLAIFLFSIAFPLTRISDIKLKTEEINTQTEVLEIDLKYVENDLVETLVNKGDLSPKEKEIFRKYLVELLNMKTMKESTKEWEEKSEPILNPQEQAAFRSRLNEIRKKLAEVKGQRRKALMLLNELKTYYFILCLGGLLGLMISLKGFHCWYSLIQKPNDMLLKKQIENAKTQHN